MSRFQSMLFAACAMGALAAGSARASFISNSPDPLLGGDMVSSGDPIATPFGFMTFTITDIFQTGTFFGENGVGLDYTATPVLNFYADPGKSTLLTSSEFEGEFTVRVFGRETAYQTGTFNFRFLSSMATGTVNGIPVAVQLDPTQDSDGTTTITPGPGLGQFTISTTATQYSQFSVAGGPFVSIPELPLESVPEPTSLAVIAAGLIGAGMRRRRSA